MPIATVIGLEFASLTAGAVVIETAFAIPGLGLLTINAIFSRDCMIYVLVNLAVDLVYAALDPRIRF